MRWYKASDASGAGEGELTQSLIRKWHESRYKQRLHDV